MSAIEDFMHNWNSDNLAWVIKEQPHFFKGKEELRNGYEISVAVGDEEFYLTWVESYDLNEAFDFIAALKKAPVKRA